ncbi:sigma-70 family RNA polymerase sigma factor [Microbulbifer guangxiensis]|uniref:sigma-70 family RNA polymerase sigma factor n=1 Tax=Microbulbifer guangxiensis TaxID=2904249 RepID=UPI001F1EABC8|nr:sigma-70 family RNA polymerase sigma factor [Microbulbifer guangxiensis]
MTRNAFQNLSDEALLDYYHSTRNLRAFRQLYSRHKDSLYRYCAQMHFPSAASVVEQLWDSLLERPPELCGRLLRNWLFIRASQMLGISETATDGEENSAPRESTYAEPAAAAESDRLLSAVQKLPRIERNILLLHMECRLPLATVADIERISLSKCRALYQNGKERLREILHGPERQPWQVKEVTL